MGLEGGLRDEHDDSGAFVPMKNSGPNSPQTIRGLLNRRSQRALLDTRAQQEADILTAPMVGPFGKGFHTLHTPAGTEYVVGDASRIMRSKAPLFGHGRGSACSAAGYLSR